MIRAYAAVFSARCRVLLQYRAAALAGCATQIFWGLVKVMIFTAFYESTDEPQPMSLAQVITYVWLGQSMLLMLMPWWLDGEVEGMIRSGNVAYELVRPVDLYWLWYARGLAQKLAPFALRAIPQLIIAGAFLGLGAPSSGEALGAFVLAMLAAVALSTAMTTLMAVTLLWTISGEGLRRILPVLATVFSGMIVPLPLWPDWLRPIVLALPFAGISDLPFRLYMGHIPPEHLAWPLLHETLWTIGLVLLGRALLRTGLRRVVVQGG